MSPSPLPTHPHVTPPLLQNYSHPDRRRASTLSPGQTQTNSLVMSHTNSRHMLPLSSRLFSNSTSRLNLRSERRAYEAFDFSDGSQRRPETSHSAVSPFSRPDLNATALPEYTVPGVPQIPQQFGGPVPSQMGPPSTERLVYSPSHSPEESVKKEKGAGWRNFKMKVKSVFTSRRKKDRTSTPSHDEETPMQIGSPYGFEHQFTMGARPLLTAAALAAMAAGNVGERSAVHMNSETGGNSSAGRVVRPGGDVDALDGGVHGVVAYGQLGRLDSEGTAVEHVSDGSWETCEATRVFDNQKVSSGKR
ncbi:hypothetical protein SVAN01_00125 [Stagonosporopsis vannaccii]|nr:hypothetical protein SVAN01_00125 [Stagonosporopsis vannaccii]